MLPGPAAKRHRDVAARGRRPRPEGGPTLCVGAKKFSPLHTRKRPDQRKIKQIKIPRRKRIMEIQITSRHEKASESLQDKINAELEGLQKFYDRISSCHVILDKERGKEIM
jgi:hypothetical protein